MVWPLRGYIHMPSEVTGSDVPCFSPFLTGYHLGEHNMWHKFTNVRIMSSMPAQSLIECLQFELTARVPLIVRVPDKPSSHGQHTQGSRELPHRPHNHFIFLRVLVGQC
jgi:hypothetical protein